MSKSVFKAGVVLVVLFVDEVLLDVDVLFVG